MFNSLSLALMAVLWIYWIDRVAGQEGMNNKLRALKNKKNDASSVIASKAKQSHVFLAQSLGDCFGTKVPRNDGFIQYFCGGLKLSFLGRFLLSTALLTILWTKVSGMYCFILMTLAGAILPMVGLTQGTQAVIYRFQETDIVGFSIVGTIAFIFCLSQGRYLRRVIFCCMALMGLFGLNVLQGLCYILGTFYTSDWLIRTGNVLIVGIMVAPFAVALALLYRSSNKSEWQNQSLGSEDIESRSLKSSADL